MRRPTVLAILLLIALFVGAVGAFIVHSVAAPPAMATPPAAETVPDATADSHESRHPRCRVPGDGTGSDGTGADGTGSDGVESGERARESRAAPWRERGDDPLLVTGRVVDTRTGEPIEWATVRWTVVGDGTERGHWQTYAKDDGIFAAGPRGGLAPGQSLQLETRASRYATSTSIVEIGDHEVRLEPLDPSEPPGTIVGRVLDPDGEPAPGRHLVSLVDSWGGWFSQWVDADHAGRFRLEGVAAGVTEVRIHGMGDQLEAIVPSGGEASLDVTTWTNPVRKASNERQVIVAVPSQTVSVRAENGDGQFFRRLRTGSSARFSLSPGLWTIVWFRAWDDEDRRQIQVAAGDSPLSVSAPD